MSDLEARAARRGRRRPGAPESLAAAPDRSLGYRHLENPFEPLRVFSDDQIQAIHGAALDILETQGMKVLSADGRARYAAGGGQVDEDSMMVRLDRGLVASR
jgi:trimethylamine--corrinoid protein Co-methyltransferase